MILYLAALECQLGPFKLMGETGGDISYKLSSLRRFAAETCRRISPTIDRV